MLLGTIFQKSLKLRTALSFQLFDAEQQQRLVLRKLLKTAEKTQIGEYFHFDDILKSPDILKAYSGSLPIYDYNSIYKAWWHKQLDSVPNVTWPGVTRYFALSSGTSEASSKYIPVTEDMIKAMRRASFKQIYTLAHYNLPSNLFEKGILMVGGTTHLNFNGSYFSGDLSGINGSKIPFWFQRFYKPGKQIAKVKDWEEKIESIVENAKDWDIWIIAGVPAWLQIIIERIIERYNLKNIHELWPNLNVYAHGGVSFEPYKQGFERLLDHPLIYFETYLASEGFIAYDARSERTGMKLILNNGIYYEFIPFNEENFDEDGNVKENARAIHIGQVEENKPYSLLLTSCAGAYRYIIGDVIQFTSLKHSEIRICGRTKHFLSLCGEHLSVDNMNNAIHHVSERFNLKIKEFTTEGFTTENNLFGHRWYIGCDDSTDSETLAKAIDERLKEINDDYATERNHALEEVSVVVLPNQVFFDWLESKGKMGGQHKFPRVLNKSFIQEWKSFLASKQIAV